LINIGRKGISPFISVILLVAFAVMIAAFVINWSDLLTRETAGQVQEKVIRESVCNLNVGLIIYRDISGYQSICLNSSSKELQIDFENRGSRRIEKIHSSVVADGSSLSEEIDAKIVPGGIIRARTQANVSSPSSIQQAVFTPAVEISGESYWCSDNKVTVPGSSISTC
jgi:flagellin-like protein